MKFVDLAWMGKHGKWVSKSKLNFISDTSNYNDKKYISQF